MNAGKKKKKWAIITIVNVLLPMPLIGLILWAYFQLPKTILFFIGLPLITIICLGLYVASLIGLAIIVYKLHGPIKEGVFSTDSKEMEKWLAAMYLLFTIDIIKKFQIQSNVLIGLYNKLFDAKIGDVFTLAGYVEHSLVSIGDNSIIGYSAEVFGHMIEGDKIYLKKTIIGKNCTIGTNSVIMSGVEIGDNTIVGAMSLVPKNKKLDANSVYVGIPVRKVKTIKP